MVSLIVAVASNNVIGKDNDLIWHLPEDLKFFKKTTEGHHVIMGRKNFESIPERFRPLPNRTNVILTRNESFSYEKCKVFHGVESAIEDAINSGDNEPFIIGGGQIYSHCLENNLIDKMYVTHVHENFDGDTFFPEINFKIWKLRSSKFHIANEKNKYSFTICTYEKS